jgi:hypothetical protein
MEVFYLITIFSLTTSLVIVLAVNRNRKKVPPPIILRKLQDVKKGERIIVTIYGNNVGVDCLNNNPVDRKMFVRVYYVKQDKVTNFHEDKIYLYNELLFRDFSTLNPAVKPANLNSKLNSALTFAVEQQLFDEAAIIRDAIEKIKEIKSEQLAQVK